MNPAMPPDIGVAAEAGAAGPPPAWQLLPLLLTQGLWVKRFTPRLPEAPGERQGAFGGGQTVRLLGLGDSIIAGVGVPHMDQALTAQLAQALAQRCPQEVRWQATGRSGATSRRLLRMIEQLPDDDSPPDLVLVNNGVNDVTSPKDPDEVNALRRQVIEVLEARFPQALCFHCGLPPMGRFPALPWPLRSVFGRRAAAFDVDLATWLQSRPRSHFLPFDELPAPEQFASDGYHPGPEAVALWARKLAEIIALSPVPGADPDTVTSS